MEFPEVNPVIAAGAIAILGAVALTGYFIGRNSSNTEKKEDEPVAVHSNGDVDEIIIVGPNRSGSSATENPTTE